MAKSYILAVIRIAASGAKAKARHQGRTNKIGTPPPFLIMAHNKRPGLKVFHQLCSFSQVILKVEVVRDETVKMMTESW